MLIFLLLQALGFEDNTIPLTTETINFVGSYYMALYRNQGSLQQRCLVVVGSRQRHVAFRSAAVSVSRENGRAAHYLGGKSTFNYQNHVASNFCIWLYCRNLQKIMASVANGM